MLQIRTTIEGKYKYLDLYQNEPVNLSLSFAELQDITRKNSNFSQSFNLPGSKLNNQLFNFFYDINAIPTNFDPNNKFDAVLMWDGYEIMQGHIRLNSVSIAKGEIIYSVTFYNQIGNLMANIGDKFLFELNLSGISHPYSGAVILESQLDPNLFPLTGTTNYSYQNGKTFWGLYNIGYEYYDSNGQQLVNFDTTPLVQFTPSSATTTGIQYNPILPYFDFSGTPLNDYYFKPTIQVRELYSQILADAGYELESNFMDTAYFKRFYVPQKFLDETIYPKNALAACYTFTNAVINTDPSTPQWVNPISGVTCNDLGFTGTTTGITINEEFSDTYQYRFTFTVNPTQECDYSLAEYPYAVLYFYDGITTEVIYSNTFCDNTPTTVSVDRSLIITGTSTFGFFFLGEYSNITNYNQQIINPPRFIPTGSTIDYAAEFPANDYKQIDFITSINKYFNMIVVPNPESPERLIVEPIVDYIGKGRVLDWTTKVDFSQTQNLVPTSALVNGTLEFEFKKDQDYANDDFFKQANRVFGSDKFNLGLQYKNETTKFDTMFSSPIDITVDNSYVPLITVSSMSKLQTVDQSGTTIQTFRPFKILPKLIFRGLTLPNDNYGFIGGTGTTTGSSSCTSGITFTTNIAAPFYYDDCFGVQQVLYASAGSNTIPGCASPSSVRAPLILFPYPIYSITNTGTTCGTVVEDSKYQYYYIEESQMDRFQNLNRFTTYPFNYNNFSHYCNYRGEDRTNVTAREFLFESEDLYDIYYKPYVDDLISEENKIYNCKIYLYPQDIQGLRWNEKILINNTYFRINKINNFNILEPSICDLELVKLTREYEGHRVLYYDLTPCSGGTVLHSNSDLMYHLYAYAGNYVTLFREDLTPLGCHQVSIGAYDVNDTYEHYWLSSGFTFNGVDVFADCGCSGRTQFDVVQQQPITQTFFYYIGYECDTNTPYTFYSTATDLDTTGLVYKIDDPSPIVNSVCVTGVTSTFIQPTNYTNIDQFATCFECNPVYDADARVYLEAVTAAGGTLNLTISGATNQLFLDLKADGIYSKMRSFYPMIGGTSASIGIDAYDPGTGSDITWVGGWTFNASGATSNGTNAYGNTNVFVSALTINNMHQSVYMLNNTVLTGTGANYIGAAGASGPKYFVIGQDGTPREFYGVSENARSTTNVPLPQGQYLISSTASTMQNLYRNGSLRFSGSSSPTATINHQIYLAAMNNSGTPIQYYANQYAFVTIGQGLNATEISNLYTTINDFNTSLGRNV
jgi:hypothetical protein